MVTGYNGPGGAVTIPGTTNGMPVTGIGDYAFQYIYSLTSITIPDSVGSIGQYAFYYCNMLTAATIGNSVTSIGDGAFSHCVSLQAITMPDSLGNIGADAFLYCISLGSVAIPGHVANIGAGALRYCGSLAGITIPGSVTNIGTDALLNCDNLGAITVDPLNSMYSSLNGVLLDKSQTTLVTYPGGKDGSYTIPNTVTSIGNDAFSGCPSVTSVAIPDSVTNIGAAAFLDCGSLTNVTIGNNVTRIGDEAFSYCMSLKAITVDSTSSVYSDLNGVLFDKSQTTLIAYPDGRAENYTIPNTVTRIGDYAFSGNIRLTNVTIPSGIRDIGDGAFLDCYNLDSINIPNSVVNIGDAALEGSGLTSVTIPGGVTSIRDDAFNYCQSLTTVTIGDSVSSIGRRAFANCFSLANVYFEGNAPAVDETAFNIYDGAFEAVYYLPGTTGWGAVFAGVPAIPWTLPYPLILSKNPSFGAGANGFGFVISWATNVHVVVEACTNLAEPV